MRSTPDLRPFKARGGKLILYHGWNDPAIPALSTVNYYDKVIAKMGQHDADSFLRLYMVPGMQHCDNGPGADSFGQVGQLNFDDPQHSVDARSRTVGGKRHGALDDHRVEVCGRRPSAREDDAAAVRVSAVGEVQGQRRYE